MKRYSSTIGLLGSVLFVAGCASGGAATSASGARPESYVANTAGEVSIPRWSCTPSNTTAAPNNGLIADFSAKSPAGAHPAALPIKLFTAVPPEFLSSSSVNQTAEQGKLTIQVHAPAGAKPQVLTAALMFDGCVDASGFAGVQFNISGALSGCALNFASVDPDHQYYRAEGPYPPQMRVSAGDLTAQPRTFKAPFATADIKGSPATPVDAGKLASLQWLVIVPVAPDDGSSVAPCTGTIALDDVKLYRP